MNHSASHFPPERHSKLNETHAHSPPRRNSPVRDSKTFQTYEYSKPHSFGTFCNKLRLSFAFLLFICLLDFSIKAPVGFERPNRPLYPQQKVPKTRLSLGKRATQSPAIPSAQ